MLHVAGACLLLIGCGPLSHVHRCAPRLHQIHQGVLCIHGTRSRPCQQHLPYRAYHMRAIALGAASGEQRIQRTRLACLTAEAVQAQVLLEGDGSQQRRNIEMPAGDQPSEWEQVDVPYVPKRSRRRRNSEDRRLFISPCRPFPSSSSTSFSCTSVEHHHHVENKVTHGLAALGAFVFLDGCEWQRLAQARQGRELLLECEGRQPAEGTHRRQVPPASRT
jgi:hypothetical protein